MTTILVADDDPLVGEVLAWALKEEGYRVTRVGNGRAALEAIRTARPDLVITDYLMPLMNGVELAEAVRLAYRDDPPPIILTSGAQAHIARRSTALFAAVFDKPFRMAGLLDRVRAIAGPPDGRLVSENHPRG